MTIYVAGAWLTRQDAAQVAADLGHPVSLAWWDLPEDGDPGRAGDLERDAIRRSDAIVVLMTEAARWTLWEWGYAAGLGVRAVVIDPSRRATAHPWPHELTRVVATVAEARDALRALEGR